MIAFNAQHGSEYRLRQEAEPDAHAGCKRFAVSPRINHAVPAALDGQCGWQVISLKAQLAIRRVLQQVQRMARRLFVLPQ